jgi:hypothetical protein
MARSRTVLKVSFSRLAAAGNFIERRCRARTRWCSMAVFQASKGMGRLDLNAGPTLEQLEAYLVFAYLLLLDDAEDRSSPW